jgi:rubrerythrin
MTPVHPDTLAALTAGIQSEVASYVFYSEALKKNLPIAVKEILKTLALEEKDHFHVLERQYDSLVRSEKWISTADILKQEGLPEIDEAMQSKHQALIDQVGRTNQVGQILDIALRLEEEARDQFVNAITKVVSKEGQEMFRRLAKFEDGHVRKIQELKRKFE